ncbi:dihydroorotase [archaeon]|nr:dihydroorotase [archaeon]
MSLAIKNGKVYLSGKLIEAEILCVNGKIREIAKHVKGEQELDVNEQIVLPGIIDAHVHFRVPGGEHKEDWNTGSRSAVKGGVTSVFDMPNTNPAIITNALLEKKRKLVKNKSFVNYGFYFGASKEHLEELNKIQNVPGIKIYMSSTTGDLLVEDEENIKKVFQEIKKRNQLAFCHAEDETMLQKAIANADPSDPLVHCKSRPKQCAIEGARHACEIAKQVGNRLHITHISTPEEVEVIKQHKASCDTTTTYLFLEERDLEEKGNYAKMNPPVRSHEDRMALWEELKAGRVDMITTDHAPHTKEEKDRDYAESPAGVPGVQTLVPLLLNEVNRRNLSIQDFVRMTSENPALITRAKNKGSIAEGFDADLTIIDMHLRKKVSDDAIESKCAWTPYHGRSLKGWPTATIVNGRIAWDGSFQERNGKEVIFK